MNRITQRPVVSSLALCSFAFLLVEFTTFASRLERRLAGGHAFRLDDGLARLDRDMRTSALSKRRSLFEGRTSAWPKRDSSFGARSTRKPRVSDLFRNNCARCHGADGRADTPLGHTYQTPDLTDPEWWRKNSKITSTASLISIVSRGRGGMPAFGKKLKRSEIRQLVGYVRKFKTSRSTNR